MRAGEDRHGSAPAIPISNTAGEIEKQITDARGSKNRDSDRTADERFKRANTTGVGEKISSACRRATPNRCHSVPEGFFCGRESITRSYLRVHIGSRPTFDGTRSDLCRSLDMRSDEFSATAGWYLLRLKSSSSSSIPKSRFFDACLRDLFLNSPRPYSISGLCGRTCRLSSPHRAQVSAFGYAIFRTIMCGDQCGFRCREYVEAGERARSSLSRL